MHMADSLISTTVGVSMLGACGIAATYSVSKIMKANKKTESATTDLNNQLTEKNLLPKMGVMGAFVFAAQMINFAIPMTGASGHITGGILLSSILGGPAAFLVMAAVILLQALIFSDGGLISYGANVMNMGFVACLIVYPLLKNKIQKAENFKELLPWTLLGCTVSITAGAVGVVLETLASGITAMNPLAFFLAMVPVHVAIGLVEGVITASVLAFVLNAKPEYRNVLTKENKPKRKLDIAGLLMILTVLSIFIIFVVSPFASSNPDGLEWSVGKTATTQITETADNAHISMAKIQEKTSIIPDYNLASTLSEVFTSTQIKSLKYIVLAGSIILLIGASFIVNKRKKKAQ